MQIKRKYNVPDAVMLDAADVIYAFYVIDEPDFQNFSNIVFTNNYANDFKSEIDAARAVVKDMVIIDELAKETEDVVKKVQECIDHFNELRFFVEKAFPNSDAMLNQFGYNDYREATKNQGKFLQFMEMLVLTVDKYNNELLAQGYTNAKINQIETLAEELRQEQQEQEQFKKTRVLLTEKRINIMNKPWLRMLDIYDAAKTIYKDSPSKVAEYELPRPTGDNSGQLPAATITMASKQNPASTISIEAKGADGENVHYNFGDGNEVDTTVNSNNYTATSNTYINNGNYSIQIIATLLALWGIAAVNCLLSAINLPATINPFELNFSNNLLVSFYIPNTFTNLIRLVLANNEIDQQSINATLITINDFGTNNGYIDISGGNNAAPTGQGIAAMNQLIARGWTVITN